MQLLYILFILLYILFYEKKIKNLIYVCHSLFAALVYTFWEIAALVSTALASSALASTALVTTALVSYKALPDVFKIWETRGGRRIQIRCKIGFFLNTPGFIFPYENRHQRSFAVYLKVKPFFQKVKKLSNWPAWHQTVQKQ